MYLLLIPSGSQSTPTRTTCIAGEAPRTTDVLHETLLLSPHSSLHLPTSSTTAGVGPLDQQHDLTTYAFDPLQDPTEIGLDPERPRRTTSGPGLLRVTPCLLQCSQQPSRRLVFTPRLLRIRYYSILAHVPLLQGLRLRRCVCSTCPRWPERTPGSTSSAWLFISYNPAWPTQSSKWSRRRTSRQEPCY